MSDETRKALMEVIEAELDSYCSSPFNGALAVSLMQIIDRLLADSGVPEPDADEVERAARAMAEYEMSNAGVLSLSWETIPKNYGKEGIPGQAHYRDMARAAIAAAGPETDWLDAALGSVHPEAAIECWFQEGEPEVGLPPVTIAVVREPGGFNVDGYGDTSSEAIRNAIANALAAKQEGAG